MKKLLVITFVVIVGLYSCYDVDKFIEKRKVQQPPRVNFDPSIGVLANGVDTLNLQVIFPIAPVMDCTLVNFTVTEGVFFENKKQTYTTSDVYRNANQQYMMYAKVKSSTLSGTHYATFEMPKFFKVTLPMEFRRALPKTISTDKNKFAVKATLTDEIQLVANLKSERGLPSNGTVVRFVIADSIKSDDPKFSKYFRGLTTTDSNGIASVFFTPGSFNGKSGLVEYYVSSFGADRQEVKAMGRFNVIVTKE